MAETSKDLIPKRTKPLRQFNILQKNFQIRTAKNFFLIINKMFHQSNKFLQIKCTVYQD